MTATVLIALLAAAIWGVVDLTAAIAARRASATAAAFWLHCAGAVVLLPFLLSRIVALDAADAVAGASAGVIVGLGDVTFGLALRRAPVGAVSAIAGVICLALPVVAQVSYGERLLPAAAFGLVCAAVAVALSCLGSGSRGQVTRSGVGLALIAGIAFGIPCVLLIHAHSATAVGFLFVEKAVGALAIGSVAFAARTSLAAMGTAWLPALASGALSAGANVLYAVAVHRGPVMATSTIALALGAPSAVLLAAVFVRERLTRAQWAAVVSASIGVGALCRVP